MAAELTDENNAMRATALEFRGPSWPSDFKSRTRRFSSTESMAILRNAELKKIVRDLRVHRTLEGANEIMRLIIARALVDPSH